MILDVQSLAQEYITKSTSEAGKLQTVPKLVVIMVGNDPASAVYVRNKIKQCTVVGIEGNILHLDSDISEEDLIQKIQTLNADTSVTGILVQSPLPSHIHAQGVFDCIDPLKDVDGFSAHNITQLYSGDESGLLPCTPKGVMHIIKHFRGDVAGKKVVVIGKSTIVGKPLAMMLLNAGATVTICHSRTKDLKEQTIQADIVISAVGKKHLFTDDMIHLGALVIDVGICVEDSSDKRCLFGDCDTDSIATKADITPVPGGVGPMTIATLLANTLLAHSLQGKL